MEKIRAAFVGLGMGLNHGTLMRDADAFDVVACCDVSDDRLPRVQEEFPDINFYRSQGEMLRQENLELVALATPHHLHAPMAVEALQAGVNVVVEKPMATTFNECQRMISAARNSNKLLTVYHNRRLDPWFLSAKKLIEEGRLGNVFNIDTGIGYSRRSNTWRGERTTSGGVMFDWGAHLVDYVLHLIESEPLRVSGWFYRAPGTSARLNHDHGTLRLYFENGSIANITVSSALYQGYERFRILGTKATYIDKWEWEKSGKGRLSSENPDDPRKPLEEDIPYEDAPTEFYKALGNNLRKGEDLLVSPESAARIIQILETAELSHQAGGNPLDL